MMTTTLVMSLKSFWAIFLLSSRILARSYLSLETGQPPPGRTACGAMAASSTAGLTTFRAISPAAMRSPVDELGILEIRPDLDLQGMLPFAQGVLAAPDHEPHPEEPAPGILIRRADQGDAEDGPAVLGFEPPGPGNEVLRIDRGPVHEKRELVVADPVELGRPEAGRQPVQIVRQRIGHEHADVQVAAFHEIEGLQEVRRLHLLEGDGLGQEDDLSDVGPVQRTRDAVRLDQVGALSEERDRQ